VAGPAAAAAAVPSPIAAAPAAKSRTGKGPLIAAVAVILVLVAGGLLYSRLSYSPPIRKAPAMPQRIAGTLTEFPVDTNAQAPARPASVVTQRLGRGTQAAVLPEHSLPPGITPAGLARHADTMTSAVYRATPSDPPVNVHVLNTLPGSPHPGQEIAGEVRRSMGPQTEEKGIKVTSPKGEEYAGWKVQSPQAVVYVLDKGRGGVTIIIYAPDPAARTTADRLAGNVGNGGGLTDYPEVQDSLFTLPPELPGGLDLQEANTFDTAASSASLSQVASSMGAGNSPETQQAIAKVQQSIPERITTARYRDRTGQDWNIGVGDYRNTRRAWTTWLLFRALLAFASARKVDLGYGSGLAFEQNRTQFVVVQRGPYLAVAGGPAGRPVEEVILLMKGLQF
jgi:hypothetical protein